MVERLIVAGCDLDVKTKDGGATALQMAENLTTSTPTPTVNQLAILQALRKRLQQIRATCSSPAEDGDTSDASDQTESEEEDSNVLASSS